jgi:hypothetical protein
MMFDLNCAILMRALLRLSLHAKIFTIGNIKPSLRNLVNHLMIILLSLSLLLVICDLVVFLLTLTMIVLNNYFMLSMIMCGV